MQDSANCFQSGKQGPSLYTLKIDSTFHYINLKIVAGPNPRARAGSHRPAFMIAARIFEYSLCSRGNIHSGLDFKWFHETLYIFVFIRVSWAKKVQFSKLSNPSNQNNHMPMVFTHAQKVSLIFFKWLSLNKLHKLTRIGPKRCIF